MDKQPLVPASERAVGAKGVLARIWKYKLHYVIVLPGMFLIFFFKIIPLLLGLYLPFVNYKAFLGVFSSAWVGMGNFTKLFDDPTFLNVLSNTLLIKAGYIAGSGILAFLLALALSCIRSGRLRDIFSTLFLIPYFIPSVIVAYIVMLLCSQSQSPLGENSTLLLIDPNWFRPLLVMVDIIKTCGIPVLLALTAIASKQRALVQGSDLTVSFMHRNVMPAVKVITAFMLMQLSTLLSTDYELIGQLLNPLVYNVGDTLDTYQFRVGLLTANFSISGAVWLFQFAVQLLLTLLIYRIIRSLFINDLFHRFEPAKDLNNESSGKRAAGIVVVLVYAFAIVFFLYILFIYPFLSGSPSGAGLRNLYSLSHFNLYLVINLAAVVVHLVLILTLAYPLTVKDLPGRGMYKTFLLIAVVVGAGSIPEYILFKSLGMLNTFFPHMLNGFFSIIHIFVLKSIFNGKYAELKEKASAEGRGELHSFIFLFIPKIWKPWLALGVLQFVSLWNSYYDSLLYVARQDLFPPVLVFRMISINGLESDGLVSSFGDPMILQYGALICLPPIVLLFIFRKLLTSEVLTSQIRKL